MKTINLFLVICSLLLIGCGGGSSSSDNGDDGSAISGDNITTGGGGDMRGDGNGMGNGSAISGGNITTGGGGDMRGDGNGMGNGSAISGGNITTGGGGDMRGDGNGMGNGSAGGSNGGGGGGNGGQISIPAEVEWSIIPFDDGLRIQWRNLADFNQTGAFVHLNLTSGNSSQPIERRITIADFTNNNYEIAGLDNGTAYRLVGIAIELTDNTSRVIGINWLTETNQLNNDGGGIVVGPNYDNDSLADLVDPDDDNDGVGDMNEAEGCRLDSDCDNDGVGDADEVMGCERKPDCDNDRVGDADEVMGCERKPDCDEDKVLDIDEVMGCELSPDCDNDRVGDADEMMGCERKPDCDNDSLVDSDDFCPTGQRDWRPDGSNDVDSDGCRNNEDIDDDGDGLIEIETAAELNTVRFVLNGTGYKADRMAELNQTGCGGRANVSVCSGYELMQNISLTNYIAEFYPILGWQPIAADTNLTEIGCDNNRFTAIFDGNGFVVSGLFINRSEEDCIGLFGRVNGTIRHLGVLVDRVIGFSQVGGLIGDGSDAEVVSSYMVNGEIAGAYSVSGLIGSGQSAEILHSYAINSLLRAIPASLTIGEWFIGGLVGYGPSASIIQSYAVNNEVSGRSHVGGLIGWGQSAEVTQSYAVNNEIAASTRGGGLMGHGGSAEVTQSYAVTGDLVSMGIYIGNLIGEDGSIQASYWDKGTSNRKNEDATGSSGQNSRELRWPTDYEGIYSTWENGTMVDGMDDNSTIWCDEDTSGMIEDDEMRGKDHVMGDNRVWDFGTSNEYPAIRCTPDDPASQRDWWFLDSGLKPQLDTTRVNGWLNGTLR